MKEALKHPTIVQLSNRWSSLQARANELNTVFLCDAHFTRAPYSAFTSFIILCMSQRPATHTRCELFHTFTFLFIRSRRLAFHFIQSRDLPFTLYTMAKIRLSLRTYKDISHDSCLKNLCEWWLNPQFSHASWTMSQPQYKEYNTGFMPYTVSMFSKFQRLSVPTRFLSQHT